MESAARRFASWVLSLHVLLLAALVITVAFVTYEVYSSARRQALDQVRIRQELLAAQAGRGLSYFYRNVLEDVELLARAQPNPAAPEALPAAVWEQLRGRASHLFQVDLQTARVIGPPFRDEQKIDLARVTAHAAPWLSALTKPAIADALDTGNGALATLVAVPVSDGPHPQRAWVAVVPLLSIETRFLNDFNQPANMGAMLADGRWRVLSAEDRPLIGTVLTSAGVDPRVRNVAEESARSSQRTTREFLGRTNLGSVQLEPAMVTIQPVDLPDGKIWWLAVSSSLSDVDAAVAKFVRRALIGAALIIAAMTAILVSTSTQIIRGRLRLERVQRAALTRELDQARQIQLMWLPEQQTSPPTGDQAAGSNGHFPLDITAVNRPASHVSGDFYNWFELESGRVCIVIGDVTGHGLPAAFLMATTQLLVRAIIERIPDPGRCLRETNRLLCTHVFSGQFVTLLVMVLDPQRNTLDLATAGHPAPLIGSGDHFQPLNVEPELVLAVDRDVAYRTQHFDLPSGASIVLYTDGVTDVQAPDGRRMTDQALHDSLVGTFRSAKDIVAAVLDTIDTFRAGREPADDLTLVAVQVPASPAPREIEERVTPQSTAK